MCYGVELNLFLVREWLETKASFYLCLLCFCHTLSLVNFLKCLACFSASPFNSRLEGYFGFVLTIPNKIIHKDKYYSDTFSADEVNARIEDFSDWTISSWSRCNENKTMPTSKCSSVSQQENAVDVGEKILQTPVSKVYSSNEGEEVIVGTPQEKRSEVQLMDDSSNGLQDVELSPRLSNFIKAGVVPESPIDYTGLYFSPVFPSSC